MDKKISCECNYCMEQYVEEVIKYVETKNEKRKEINLAMKEFIGKRGRINKQGWYFNKHQFTDRLKDVTNEETLRGAIVPANQRKA